MSNRNKKYYQTLFLLLFLLIAYSLQLNATIRYVSKTGNSTPPYTSWETAADSIQKCINICVFGDTIYVANGIYQEQVVMIEGLSLIGTGMDSCIIDTRYMTITNFRVVEVMDSCLFTGFHIKPFNNTNGGRGIAGGGNSLITLNKITNGITGILVGASPTVYKNICMNSRNGIWATNSSSLIRKNTIINLIDPIGTAIRVADFDMSYRPIVDSNYIETVGYDAIVKFLGTRPIIKNNTVIYRDNMAATGISLYYSDSAWVYNNLVLAKRARYGIENLTVVHLQLYNNYVGGEYTNFGIILGAESEVVLNNAVTNSAGGIYGYESMDIRYNNCWNNITNYANFSPDSTNISVDPMAVNDDSTQGELDFHLQKYSPLIDAGDPNILDKDGTRSDIGLYGGPYGESYLYQDFAPKPPRGLFANVDTSLIELTWQKNTEADFNHYNLYRDTTSNFQIDSTKLVASLTDTFYLHIIPQGVERLYFKLTGVDNQGNESNPSEEVAVILATVKNEWKAVNNYILYQNYPNPFNPTTKIGYKLKERGYVKLYVYDVKGELVEVLVNQTQEAGYYEVKFNGEGKTELIGVKNPFVSGVYLCQIIVQSERGIPVFSDIKKMILLK